MEDPFAAKDKEKIRLNNEKKKEVISALQEMDIEDIRCGIGPCTPNLCQGLATKNIYLMVYCIVGLVIGMFFTYSVSTISTIEKRFKLTSKQTGVMLAGNDISQIMFSILVAYFGNYGNRPKWLGIGVLSASFSCFLAAVPHFVYGPGQDAIDVAISLSSASNSSSSPSGALSNSRTKSKNDLCHSPYIGDCKEGGSDFNTSYLGPVVILFFSEFFVGIAVSVFYSLGLVYLDDNVNKKDSPLYYAISMIVRVAGPVLGFFLGSKCLALYIDPKYKPNISLRDPRWLGAWWLGFLLLGVLLAVCGVMMLFFPRTLPSTLYKQIKRIQLTESTDPSQLTKDSDLSNFLKLAKAKQRFTKPSIKKLPTALKRLFTNKIWVGNNFNAVLALLAMMGYWSFKPKYLEYQFRKSASSANFYTGIASLVSSILGLSISGIIIRVFRPGPRFITGYSCFLTLFSSITMLSLMFIGCPKLDVVGPDFNSSELAYCNDDCGCTDRYSPVCSEDGLTTFYSPCYAGCTAVNTSATPVEYLNCKCVSPVTLNNVSAFDNTQAPNLYEVCAGGHNVPELREDCVRRLFRQIIRLPSVISNVSPQSNQGKTTQGYCPETCDTFFYYIIITIITKTIDSTGRIGGTLVYLRSVEEQDKGLALGVSTVLISLFSFIPAPIIMGAVVDSACIIWDNTCGQRGNCWLYDSDKFRIIIHAFPATIILISLLGDIFVFINSKHLVLYGEDEENPQTKNTVAVKEKQQNSENREMKLLNRDKL